MSLRLKVLNGSYSIELLDQAPEDADCWAIIRDREECTVIREQEAGSWRAIRIDQEFGLDVVGILLQILNPLAAARIPIMAYSTYKTDYVFVDATHLPAALGALTGAGHEVVVE